jgi:hypothetical protein
MPADQLVSYRRHPSAGIARRLDAADTMTHDSYFSVDPKWSAFQVPLHVVGFVRIQPISEVLQLQLRF